MWFRAIWQEVCRVAWARCDGFQLLDAAELEEEVESALAVRLARRIGEGRGDETDLLRDGAGIVEGSLARTLGGEDLGPALALSAVESGLQRALGLENGALFVALGDVNEGLGVEDLLAALALGGHLELELLFDLAVARHEGLYLEAGAVDTPLVDAAADDDFEAVVEAVAVGDDVVVGEGADDGADGGGADVGDVVVEVADGEAGVVGGADAGEEGAGDDDGDVIGGEAGEVADVDLGVKVSG